MSYWLKHKDLCHRCFSGIDVSKKGNCSTCESLTYEQAAWMKRTRLAMELEAAEEEEISAMAESLIRGADNLFS